MRVILVAGARPNFMKIGPLLAVLERRGVDAILVHTGQHYDAAMSDVFFDELDIRAPDHHLGAGSGSHAEQTAAAMLSFERLLDREAPNVVLVPGDVNSTLACAIVAAKAGCLVGHIEAGLRSRDWSMPEEINRVVADRVSDLLFAPSADAVANLTAEGYRHDQIHLVGNVMVDTLLLNVDRARQRPVLSDLGLSSGAYGVVTLHRPANVDEDDILGQILDALAEVAMDLPLVLPAHPRAGERIRKRNRSTRVSVIDPLGYLDFLALQAQAALALTDSGGVQEETTALGIPCITLRDNTERPITVTEGTNCVEVAIEVPSSRRRDAPSPEDSPRRCPALWDGKASERIADVLLGIDLKGWQRPTSPRQD